MHNASVLILELWRNFLIRNSTNIKMIRDLITVSGTLRMEQYWQPLQPLTKNKKRLWIDVIDDLTRYSYIAKLKITSSWYRTKSKATTGVKKSASYICWLYTTWNQLAASNMIPCDFFWWQQPLYKLFASSSNNSCWLS